MTSIEDVLERATAFEADGRGRLRAAAALQSWPGVVHGGGLVALLDAAAGRLNRAGGARVVEGRLTSPVPPETDLALEGTAGDGITAVSVLRDGAILSSVSVRTGGEGAPRPLSTWAGGAAGLDLPMSEQCLACGTDNPLGLRVGLRFDEVGVWARLAPPATWITRTEELHPAVSPVLLDEVAWWLGALTMGEGGLTNRIAIALGPGPLRPDQALVAAGRLADVQPVDRRRTFWRTVSTLWTEDGDALATAVIVFRGGPGFSARQVPYFRARCAASTFVRIFPGHADQPPAPGQEARRAPPPRATGRGRPRDPSS